MSAKGASGVSNSEEATRGAKRWALGGSLSAERAGVVSFCQAFAHTHFRFWETEI
jgi:hypothetical protein